MEETRQGGEEGRCLPVMGVLELARDGEAGRRHQDHHG